MKKQTSKWIIFINIFLWTIILVIGGWLIYAYFWHNPQYIEPTIKARDLVFNVERDVTRETIRKEISELFGNPNYTVSDDGDTYYISGHTNLITRKITMYFGLNNANYAFTFAHELVHLTELVLNERYCEIKAFKVLYFSGNEYLRNCAIYGVYMDLLGRTPDEYKFTGNIEEFLQIN